MTTTTFDPIICRIMLTGARITSDMLDLPQIKQGKYGSGSTEGDIELWRKALPPETLNTADTNWEVDPRTLNELYMIWQMTGVMEPLKAVDSVLHDLLDELMMGVLADAGY